MSCVWKWEMFHKLNEKFPSSFLETISLSIAKTDRLRVWQKQLLNIGDLIRQNLQTPQKSKLKWKVGNMNRTITLPITRAKFPTNFLLDWLEIASMYKWTARQLAGPSRTEYRLFKSHLLNSKLTLSPKWLLATQEYSNWVIWTRGRMSPIFLARAKLKLPEPSLIRAQALDFLSSSLVKPAEYRVRRN